jgi:hypothetical protein
MIANKKIVCLTADCNLQFPQNKKNGRAPKCFGSFRPWAIQPKSVSRILGWCPKLNVLLIAAEDEPIT